MLLQRCLCRVNRLLSLRPVLGMGGAIALAMCSTGAIAQTTEETPEPLEETAQIIIDTGDLEMSSETDLLLETLLTVPSRYDLQPNFDLEEVADAGPLVDEDDVDLFEPTTPSLWWRRDQMPTRWSTLDATTFQIDGGYRLIRNWTSFYSEAADTYIVDVRVDPQYWNRYNYFQQYAILTQLGTAAMSYGYHIRIFNSATLVGIHACGFNDISELADTPQVEVPVPELDDLQCSAAIGPFISFVSPVFEEDLFAPP
ncbi:hypothetical protein PN498_03420 [Oscillatoria sp. CS-180]|uniref:hypothetical protein n=1 Tax=Oscillatoria sp. CS-180 TaxID=3021720 RepID=UPI00232F052B|nr:hypothetical protein [Oscillatoria sp. CS-180]MDB9525026.1 hypothetical protein [Oscillatoria sp. CS-180]